MEPIRVLVVDDHPVIRAGIRAMLSGVAGIEVVGEAATGAEALQQVETLAPDILVLDMELPDMGGVEIAQALQQSGSPVRILALSAHLDRGYIENVLKSGAAGYLVKDEAPGQIVEAVQGVAGGETGWISRQIVADMVSWIDQPRPVKPRFTRRETQVLDLLQEGKTNLEIAFALKITDKSVEKHLASIFNKIGVRSRTEAAVWAAREKLDPAVG